MQNLQRLEPEQHADRHKCNTCQLNQAALKVSVMKHSSPTRPEIQTSSQHELPLKILTAMLVEVKKRGKVEASPNPHQSLPSEGHRQRYRVRGSSASGNSNAEREDACVPRRDRSR